jgi:hypothetical protein
MGDEHFELRIWAGVLLGKNIDLGELSEKDFAIRGAAQSWEMWVVSVG